MAVEQGAALTLAPNHAPPLRLALDADLATTPELARKRSYAPIKRFGSGRMIQCAPHRQRSMRICGKARRSNAARTMMTRRASAAHAAPHSDEAGASTDIVACNYRTGRSRRKSRVDFRFESHCVHSSHGRQMTGLSTSQPMSRRRQTPAASSAPLPSSCRNSTGAARLNRSTNMAHSAPSTRDQRQGTRVSS